MLKLLRQSLAFGVIFACSAVSAGGATFEVNSSRDLPDVHPGDGIAAAFPEGDSAHCTLRAALEEAAAWPGPDTIMINQTVSPVVLSLGELVLSDHGTLLRGDGSTVIDAFANPRYRPTFVVSSDSNLISGVQIRFSRAEGVRIQGKYNSMGESGDAGRIKLTSGGLDNPDAASILIEGHQAIGNTISNCWIGIDGNGSRLSPNRNGIRVIDGASGNLIGGPTPGTGNLISGNHGYGVSLEEGAYGNQVAGNYIGVDFTGNLPAPNGGDGVRLLTGAHDNLIGGIDLSEGNLISGNRGNGVLLEGSTVTQNTVNGNRIGLEAGGGFEAPNAGDGIRLTTGTHHNLIGGEAANSGNVISGNDGSGIHISGLGTDHNKVQANWVGLQLNGFADAGNGRVSGEGILIDGGARFNQIGGSISYTRNVVSGNFGGGVRLTGVGTEHNAVIGNYIGTNYTGTSSVFNNVGVIISDGARFNEIGRDIDSSGNLLSGNRADFFPYGAGVLIYGVGTDYNLVRGNLIGLDVSGRRALRNGSSGVIIGDGAQYNTVGGETPSERNYIAGNSSIGPVDGVAAGVHLFGLTTSYNRIVGNVIGAGPTDPPVLLENWGHGVGLFAGASRNEIGGNGSESGNFITGSQGHGIIASGIMTNENLIRFNSLTDNDSLGIALRDGAQDGILPPATLSITRVEADTCRVHGSGARPGATVDIYLVAAPDPSGAGEGFALLSSGTADFDGAFDFYFFTGEPGPLIVTAITTDSSRNSSAFALNATSGDITAVDGPAAGTLPLEFELAQNYPNPFNARTVISFSLPTAQHARLEVFNALGQRLNSLLDELLPPGSHAVVWDGLNAAGEPVATGVYFYRLSLPDRLETRKMLLLK